MKNVLIIIAVFLAIGCVFLGIFWHDIFQYSAENIIKNNLPPYVKVNRIIFDLNEGVIRVQDLGIKNPPGYQEKYLAEISEITCSYRLMGKTPLDGIEVTEIRAEGGVINIERLRNGRLNVTEMDKVMNPSGSGASAEEKAAKEARSADAENKTQKKFDISKHLKLPDTINIRGAKVLFIDRAVQPSPYMLTFEDINTDLDIDLNEDYTEVLSAASQGSGLVGGARTEVVNWKLALDPRTPELTMSSRFNLSGVNVIPFRPYYDVYSPINIKRGTLSGTLVFDFDNGNIGSTNTLNLDNFEFTVKESAKAAEAWGPSLPDIVKYLETYPGSVTFDFKIKGDMKNPQFSPGPIVKKAMQNMAADTIAGLLTKPTEEEQAGTAPGTGTGTGTAEKSDTEKIVDVLQGLLKKDE